MKKITVLRYPGGKFKALKFIKPYWEKYEHHEYREPFLGGGSVFINKPKAEHNILNDRDENLIAFFKTLKSEKKRTELISNLKALTIDKELYDKYYFSKPKTLIEKAERYYVLNRCSFSGITVWNSYLKGNPRWNIENSIEKLNFVGKKLKNTDIKCEDFEKIIKEKSKHDVFMFIDPPYAESRQQAAYSKTFDTNDHLRLEKALKQTEFKFLLTYDNCEFIQDLYSWAYKVPLSWTYSVANAKVHHNPREAGNELFISNFEI